MQKYIKGTYTKTIFNSDNGYYIGLFRVRETNYDEYRDYINKTVTITGYFNEILEEQNYLLFGEFVNNPKYGMQFNAQYLENAVPEERDEIVDFLSSDLFYGIGKKKAQNIVDHLGDDAINIILDDKESLRSVKGISIKNMEDIYDVLYEYQNSYKTVLYLNELGFSTKDSLTIYKKYNTNTLDKINNDIYNLYYDIRNITYKKVDSIAIRNSLKKDDIRRIKASIIYVMTEYANSRSDTYMLNGDIFTYTKRVVGYDMPNVEFDDALDELILDFKVIKVEDKYFLEEYYESENYINNRIKYLTKDFNEKVDLNNYIKDLESVFNIKYNNDQKNAITSAVYENFLVITGGPGTGKTTIIRSIVSLLLDYDESLKEEDIVLLAPTGRASKRLMSLSNFEAGTIHRYLKWQKESDKFLVNEYNKESAKVVIIDEASMLDTTLFSSLLKGLHNDTKIVLVGDYDQLPSVGAGQVLKDLIDSDVVPTVVLNELYRTSDDSNINILARSINDNHFDLSLIDNNSTYFFELDNYLIKEKLKELILSFTKEELEDTQILAPMYKTINGIDNLNYYLQSIYNPKDINKNEIIINGVVYREYDKVIQLINNTEESVFNGDIGFIKYIDNKRKRVIISFDNNDVTYTLSDFNTFKHAYVISVHKAQGSEFDNVITLFLTEYNRMLYKKLIYTAVTRAKKKLFVIGNSNSINRGLLNNFEQNRKTNLKDLLINN